MDVYVCLIFFTLEGDPVVPIDALICMAESEESAGDVVRRWFTDASVPGIKLIPQDGARVSIAVTPLKFTVPAIKSLWKTGIPIMSTNGPARALDPFPKGGEDISPYIEGLWKKHRKEKKK